MPTIEIRNLTARYQNQVVLHDLSLLIREGELFFLVGPSGCGKTTLLRLIAGFQKPEAGEILFDGKAVTHVPPHRRETAMMFQSYALWPHMTVAENVAFGLEERGLARNRIDERVKEALAVVQLDGLQFRAIGELSGGQQQRVALARALIVRPRCLLLDEPLSNLDAYLRLEMRSEIRRICKAHQLTAIYVTHDQDEALSMADQIAVMKDGRVLQVGPPECIYRRPVNRAVAAFMGETNLIGVEVIARLSNAETVRILWGQFEIDLPLQPGSIIRPSDGPAFLSIRPEAFQLVQPQETSIRLEGDIEGVSYLGATVSYRVKLQNEASLNILLINPAGPLRSIGDPLTLWVALIDMVFLGE